MQQPKLYHEFKKLTILKLKETSPPIDMELCPKCNEVQVVYDCPRDSCKRLRHLQQQAECRGCRYCIPRCEECGICIKDEEEEPEEAACPDSLCLGCWLQLPKCSFCNKPYCSDHSDQQCFLPESSGFVCTPCHAKFIENPWFTVPRNSLLSSELYLIMTTKSSIFRGIFCNILLQGLSSKCIPIWTRITQWCDKYRNRIEQYKYTIAYKLCKNTNFLYSLQQTPKGEKKKKKKERRQLEYSL